MAESGGPEGAVWEFIKGPHAALAAEAEQLRQEIVFRRIQALEAEGKLNRYLATTIMTKPKYEQLREGLLAAANEIQVAKQPAYTRNSEDVLANFKEAARQAGISPGRAWVVLATKHWDAVVTAMTQPDVPQGEALEGRFADVINYVLLAWALLHDQEEG